MPRSGLPKVALPPGRVRGKCPDAARLHYQCSEKTRQQRSGWVVVGAGAAVPSWTHSWNTEKPAARPKPRGGSTFTTGRGARTLCAPNTHQRGRKCSTRQPGLHHAKSSKPAAVRYSGNADRSSSPATAANAPRPQTYSDAGAPRIPLLHSMRSRPSSLQRGLGPRPHVAHGSEARLTTAH